MDDRLSPASDMQRALPRESIFLSASVRFAKAREAVVVRVRNISDGGMMIECSQPASPGERLEAEIKNIGRIEGHVAWRTDNRMGVAFDCPVNAKKARAPSTASMVDPAYTRSALAARNAGGRI